MPSLCDAQQQLALCAARCGTCSCNGGFCGRIRNTGRGLQWPVQLYTYEVSVGGAAINAALGLFVRLVGRLSAAGTFLLAKHFGHAIQSPQISASKNAMVSGR